jgi:hypothetical protein
MKRGLIDYLVLDALANDLEDIEHILEILNSDTQFGWRDYHPEPFTREEMVPALVRAIHDGCVEACIFSEEDGALIGAGERVVPAVPLEDVWFRLTSRGRTVLENWNLRSPPE